jgi:arsenite methyltransferase
MILMQEQYIKEKVKERYGKIVLTGNFDCCCMPGECCNDSSHPFARESTKLIGYDTKDIESIPEASVLGITECITFLTIKHDI